MHAAQKAGNQQETQKHMKEYYKVWLFGIPLSRLPVLGFS